MTQGPGQRRLPAFRAGLTLVELAASLAILGVLLVACGSAIVLTTRANDAAVTLSGPDAQGVADRIAADLRMATSFSERGAAAVTFTVPDRDGDGSPETLRYAWSEDPADPLTLEYNGAQAVTIAEDVQHFCLSYLLRTVPPALRESEETRLIYHDDAPGGFFDSEVVTDSDIVAQYFKPPLPSNAVSWKILRAKWRGRSEGSTSGVIQVCIFTADAAGKPTRELLEAVSVPESSLTDYYAWHEVAFSSASALDPSRGYCLVIRGIPSEYSARVVYERLGSYMTPNTHWLTSSDGGTTWSAPGHTDDMRFYVYGTVTTAGEPQWP